MQVWQSPEHNSPGAVLEFEVVPAATISADGRGFNAAVLAVTTASQFHGDPITVTALAASERQLLDLADAIQRKLRPTPTDRVLDAIDALAQRLTD